ncbi:MAG: hypothetical protein MUC88_20785 [Planctomycetes bacterium]|nr:hypothetical protein [Planctomycetota bacterium]
MSIAESGLRYIAEAPAYEYGGFNPQTVRIAKAALRMIGRLRRQNGVCRWREDADGVWETSCGQEWQFESGGIKENHVHYCHYCGKRVKEVRA